MSVDEGEEAKISLGSFKFDASSSYGLLDDNELACKIDELSSESPIWRKYVNEAVEQDEELVRSHNASLDMLLLFAALFSAVLTGFLIESKDLLQEDLAEASVSLLVSIAQSQYRIEVGQPISPDSSLPARHEFNPSFTSRLVNGLWFISLALSLSASLVAMLGKEWLNAFLTSRPRPARSHALTRQSRLEGMERWFALHIITLLPSLLHASLLLFAIGLVIYLWALDHVISIVLAVIFGITVAFYITTAVLAALDKFCPFVTELSEYLGKAISYLIHGEFSRKRVAGDSSSLHLVQAVLWLANHARDPAIADSAYQALAGLFQRTAQKSSASGVSKSINTPKNNSQPDQLPLALNASMTTEALIITLSDRFKQLMNGSLESTAEPNMAAARYIDAILGVASHMCPPRGIWDDAAQGKPHDRRITVGTVLATYLAPFELLESIELIWSGFNSNIRPNAYARILISTMDIMLPAALKLEIISRRPNTPALVDPNGYYHAPGNYTHAIELATTDLAPETSVANQLQILRWYYSQWLLRVSYLIHLHVEESVSIDAELISSLLHAATDAALCSHLNPSDGTSTHHPPVKNPKPRAYAYIVRDNSRHRSSRIRSDELHKGPLGALVELLWKRPSLEDESPIETCLSALHAYAALAPVILQQVLALPRHELVEAFRFDGWGFAPQDEMMGLRYIATRMALLTVRYLSVNPKTFPSHSRFCSSVLGLVDFCLRRDNSYRFRKDSYWALAHHAGDIVPLLRYAGSSDSNYWLLDKETTQAILNIVRVRSTSHGITACDNLITPECFPPLIRMIGEERDIKADQLELLLQAMIRRIRADNSKIVQQPDIPWNNIPAIEYLYLFTRTKDGFIALAEAIDGNTDTGLHGDGIGDSILKPLALFTLDTVHLAAGRDSALQVESVEFSLDAVPGLLRAVLGAIKCIRSQKGREEMMLQLSTDTLDLLRVAREQDYSENFKEYLTSCTEFWDSLQALEASNDAGPPEALKFFAKFKDITDIEILSDQVDDDTEEGVQAIGALSSHWRGRRNSNFSQFDRGEVSCIYTGADTVHIRGRPGRGEIFD